MSGPMPKPNPFLFVSHVSEDGSAAMQIVAELERRGVRCWVTPRDVRPGKSFDDEIDEAIQNCWAMLLIFSSNGYLLADRGTWIHLKNKGDLQIMVEGDKRMFNQYGVILVNPAKHPNVKRDLGQQFIDWLVSPEGQRAIADYKIHGEQLFFPNATSPNA
jgi:TIR domain